MKSHKVHCAPLRDAHRAHACGQRLVRCTQRAPASLAAALRRQSVKKKTTPVRPTGTPFCQRWRCMMATLRLRRQPRHRQSLTARANANAPGLYRYWWWLTHYSIRCLVWLAPEIGPRSTRRRRPGTGFRAAHRAAARLAPAGFNPSRCAAPLFPERS
jgi:hypothetical protein